MIISVLVAARAVEVKDLVVIAKAAHKAIGVVGFGGCVLFTFYCYACLFVRKACLIFEESRPNTDGAASNLISPQRKAILLHWNRITD